MTVEELRNKWRYRWENSESAHDELIADCRSAGYVGMCATDCEICLILDLDGADVQLLLECLFCRPFWTLI